MSPYRQKNRDLTLAEEIRWMVVVSGVVHFIFFGVAASLPEFRKQKKIVFPSYTVVDLVHLPAKKKKKKIKRKKKTKIVKKKAKPFKKKVKPIKKKKPVLVSKPVETEKEDDFLQKLDELQKRLADEEQRILEEKNRLDEERRLNEAEFDEKLAALKEKWADEEEQLSAQKRITASEYSNSVKLDSPDFSVHYLSIIIDSINEMWKLPIGRSEYSGTKAVLISFRIFRNGDIAAIEIEDSSGISVLDTAAMQAVIDTRHLPPLPDEFTENYVGVHFRFEYSYSE